MNHLLQAQTLRFSGVADARIATLTESRNKCLSAMSQAIKRLEAKDTKAAIEILTAAIREQQIR